MGGTFDPVHIGHLVCAEEARWQFGLDEVVFVPAGQPWQKRQVTPAEDRYLLTVLATASNPHFSVSRLEIDRGGPTYTLETLRALREFHSAADLFFITGADAVLEILTWKDPDSVLQTARFIAATRPEFDLGKLDLGRFGDRVSVIQIPWDRPRSPPTSRSGTSTSTPEIDPVRTQLPRGSVDRAGPRQRRVRLPPAGRDGPNDFAFGPHPRVSPDRAVLVRGGGQRRLRSRPVRDCPLPADGGAGARIRIPHP
jgi:nicotinate-nucleotide adenylyltransferase